jgi:CubicO group peptidase (beta-lactamase class C family)
MSIWTPCLASVVLLAANGLVHGPPPQDEEALERRIEALVETTCEEHDVPGLALTIGIGSEHFLARAWGVADAGSGEMAEVDSLFRAGSLSVQIAAVAALTLVDSGELSLDDDVAELLGVPEGAGDETSALAGVTLRHLLAQTSGLPDYAQHVASIDAERDGFDLEHVLTWLAATPPDADPGTCFAYSTTNAFLAGSIVERAAGTTLAQFAEERLFAPLDLEDTRYCTTAPAIRELADAVQEVRGSLEDDGPGPHPFQAEALCTSANDLFRWTRALIEGALLDASSTELLLESATLAGGRETGFGLGVNRTTLEGEECIAFGGGMAGARVHAAHYPVLNLTIVVLAASEDAPVDHLERRIARLFFHMSDPELLDLELTAEERALYVGGYYEGCTRLDVLVVGERLALLAPYEESEPLVLLSQGDHVFVARDDPGVRLEFVVEGGAVVSFVLDEHGVERRAKRLD